MRVLLLSILIDWLFGDPPNALHPVAWFGRFVHALERHAPRDQPHAQLLRGVEIAASGVVLAAVPGLALERIFASRHKSWFGILAISVALKMTFAWRGLLRAGEKVAGHLDANALEDVRRDLRALVSRDTLALDAPRLSAAAIESLAENASDGFVAPLFYYMLFGLPGAFAYRAVNTMDSMIGYHGRYEYLGKVAARLDDALNLIPARVTALLFTAAAWLTRANAMRAWQTLCRDHARTESPNAGYPMSAMAGALDVRLEKVDHYVLNEKGRAPSPTDIRRATKMVSVALGLAVVASVWLQICAGQSAVENRKPEI